MAKMAVNNATSNAMSGLLGISFAGNGTYTTSNLVDKTIEGISSVPAAIGDFLGSIGEKMANLNPVGTPGEARSPHKPFAPISEYGVNKAENYWARLSFLRQRFIDRWFMEGDPNFIPDAEELVNYGDYMPTLAHAVSREHLEKMKATIKEINDTNQAMAQAPWYCKLVGEGLFDPANAFGALVGFKVAGKIVGVGGKLLSKVPLVNKTPKFVKNVVAGTSKGAIALPIGSVAVNAWDKLSGAQESTEDISEKGLITDVIIGGSFGMAGAVIKPFYDALAKKWLKMPSTEGKAGYSALPGASDMNLIVSSPLQQYTTKSEKFAIEKSQIDKFLQEVKDSGGVAKVIKEENDKVIAEVRPNVPDAVDFHVSLKGVVSLGAEEVFNPEIGLSAHLKELLAKGGIDCLVGADGAPIKDLKNVKNPLDFLKAIGKNVSVEEEQKIPALFTVKEADTLADMISSQVIKSLDGLDATLGDFKEIKKIYRNLFRATVRNMNRQSLDQSIPEFIKEYEQLSDTHLLGGKLLSKRYDYTKMKSGEVPSLRLITSENPVVRAFVAKACNMNVMLADSGGVEKFINETLDNRIAMRTSLSFSEFQDKYTQIIQSYLSKNYPDKSARAIKHMAKSDKVRTKFGKLVYQEMMHPTGEDADPIIKQAVSLYSSSTADIIREARNVGVAKFDIEEFMSNRSQEERKKLQPLIKDKAAKERAANEAIEQYMQPHEANKEMNSKNMLEYARKKISEQVNEFVNRYEGEPINYTCDPLMFPRVYSRKAIKANPTGFQEQIKKLVETRIGELKHTIVDKPSEIQGKPSLKTLAERIFSDKVVTKEDIERYSTMLKDNVLYSGTGANVGIPSIASLHERVIPGKSEELANFLIQDPEFAYSRFSASMIREIECKKAFGTIYADDIINLVKNEASEMASKVSSKEADRIFRRTEVECYHIQNIFDSLMGKFKTNPYIDFIKNLNVARMLGGMVFSCFEDIYSFVARLGVGGLCKTTAKYLRLLNPLSNIDINKEGYKVVMNAIERSGSTRFEDFYQEIAGRASGKFMKRFASAVVKLSGASFVDRQMRRVAMDSIVQCLLNPVKERTEAQMKFLASYGIDAKMYDRIRQQALRYSTKNGINCILWDDEGAKKAVLNAMHSAGTNMVLSSTLGSTPQILKNPIGSALFQFKRTIVSSYERALIPTAQEMYKRLTPNYDVNTHYLDAFLVSICMNDIKAKVKEYITGVPTSKEEQLGQIDALAAPLCIYEMMTALLKEGDASGRIVGSSPLYSLLRDLMNGLHGGMNMLSKGTMTKTQLHALKRLIPGNNLWFLRKSVNAVVDKLAERYAEKEKPISKLMKKVRKIEKGETKPKEKSKHSFGGLSIGSLFTGGGKPPKIKGPGLDAGSTKKPSKKSHKLDIKELLGKVQSKYNVQNRPRSDNGGGGGGSVRRRAHKGLKMLSSQGAQRRTARRSRGTRKLSMKQIKRMFA